MVKQLIEKKVRKVEYVELIYDLMVLFRENMYVNIAVSAAYVFSVFAVIYRNRS